MSVRAKFKCTDHNSEPGEPLRHKIELQPVTSGSAENDQFYKLTPSGKIELRTVNPAAAAEFEVGVDYYVDFIRATPAASSAPPPAAEAATDVSVADAKS